MHMSTRINFTDGSHFDIPKEWGTNPDLIVGWDNSLDLAVAADEHMEWTLTPCCGASFKGCDGYIGCRSCYEDMDGIMHGGGMPTGPVTYRIGYTPLQNRDHMIP